MARSATPTQASFWALDRFRMEKVVANIAGEAEILDDDVRASLELGAEIEFVVRARVVKRSFSEKGVGQAIMAILSITPSGGEAILTRKATQAAEAATEVGSDEAPKARRGRPRKADPVFDTCGVVHRGMSSPCMNSRDDCEIEASLAAADERAARVLSEAEEVAAGATEDD